MALDVLGMFGIAAMCVFVAELVIGYFVIWKRGALEWE
jgi:NADH:ubiquinone oxidoreductase subunit 3 (subunit A)